ncbi:MAG: methyltransferase domain-containing protein [Verrucomicrobiota bacterium]
MWVLVKMIVDLESEESLKDCVEADDYVGKDLEAMSFAMNYHNWIVDEFRPYILGSVGEIGAGSGNLSRLLLDSKFENLYAFEPARSMYALLEKRFENHSNVRTYNAFLGEKRAEFRSFFDTLIYNNVMEHVEDDAAELAIDFDSLKPGGHILFFVPALSWLFSDFDKSLGHFRRYHREPTIKLFENAGFEVLDSKYMDFPGIFPWYVSFRLLRHKLSAGKVSLYDRLVPFIRFVESKLRPPVGKNLLVIGRKPV